MNPVLGEPPHLLVIEYINHDDAAECDMFVQCPFEQLQMRTVTEWRPRDMIGGPEVEHRPGQPYPANRSEWYFHVEKHYCTYNPRLYPFGERSPKIEPTLTFYSRWIRDTREEICGRIEVGRHIDVFGGCGYDDLCGANGLLDLLPIDQITNDRWEWPAEMPQTPGEYPIFYWSEGRDDDFCNGFCFEDPRLLVGGLA